MTIQELVEKLGKIEDPEGEVFVLMANQLVTIGIVAEDTDGDVMLMPLGDVPGADRIERII